MAQVRRTLLTTAIAAAMIPASASGAGFALIQNSAKSGGASYAGTAATPDDPATVFFNPAGMVRNEGTAVSAGVSYVAPEFDYEDEGSTTAGGTPVPGDGDVSSEEDGFPPYFYYMNRFSEDWAFGVAVNTPFGSRTEYADDWVGRYNSVESEIISANINPNISHRINDRVSIGFGFSVQYFEATLSNMIETGNLNPLGQPTYDGSQDALAEVSGDSWAVGANAGLMVDVTERTKLGLSWRSKIKHNLKGDVSVSGTNPGVQQGLDQMGIEDSPGSASIELPESVTLSLSHEPGFAEPLTLLADAAFTRWNRVSTIEVDADDDRLDSELDLDFQNSWRGSVGATWDQTERLQFRGGFTFDESAVKDSEGRTPRVPDNHRRWISLGAGYEFTNGVELDAAYSRIFISETGINADSGQGTTLNGNFDSSSDVFTLQATYRY